MQLLLDLKTEIQNMPDQAFTNPTLAAKNRNLLFGEVGQAINFYPIGLTLLARSGLQSAKTTLGSAVLEPWRSILTAKINVILSAL